MIVHSTRNLLDDSCLVQIEGIEPGYPESLVVLFATGAAAKHNASLQVRRGTVTEWLTDEGRPIPADADTTDATAARVACRIEAS